MNPALHVATQAANAHALAGKKIVDHFLAARAFTPASAIDAAGLPSDPYKTLDTLRKQRLVRSTDDGRLFFDRKLYEAQQARARQIAIWTMYLLFVAGLLAAAWLIYNA
jgi:hypothetical protein